MVFNRCFLFAVLVIAAVVGNASAATYVVGDSLGWTVPPSPGAYATWASRHVFRVGDVLVFNYPTGFHDVARVTKAAYDGCSSNNPIALVTAGPSNFTLSAVGADYYICTFGTHCAGGQKLAINVTAASSTAPTMPPSTTPTTPAPTMPPSTTTPPPSMPPSTTSPPPSMPPSTTPSPMSPPSSSPSASPMGVPGPSPTSTPGGPGASPTSTPGGPPAPGSESTPRAPGSESTPGATPPAPSSATMGSFSASLIVFAFALVI